MASDNRTSTSEGFGSPGLPSLNRKASKCDSTYPHSSANQNVSARQPVSENFATVEDKFRMIVERMPALIWVTNPDGNLVFANRQCIDYTGLDVTAKQNGGWARAFHPDDAERIFSKWMSSLQSGEIFELEYRIRRHDGQYRWFLGRALPERDEKGQIREWVGSATDIHDRKIAEERQSRIQKKVNQLQAIATLLAKAQTQLEIAQIVIDHGLKAVNADAGSVVLVDDGKHELNFVYGIGYAPEIAANWSKIHMDKKNPFTEAILKKEAVLLTNAQQISENFPEISQLIQNSNSRALAAFPLLVQGQALGVISLSFNTDQEFTSERTGYLMILAEQCAQAIERARLFEAEKTARENAEVANLAKSQFLANMSHEIRTPMNAILGFSDLLGDSFLTEEERADYRKRIRTNGNQLLHLIDDILDLSKVEAGKLDFEKTRFSILDLVQEVHDSLTPILQPNGIAIRLLIEKNVPTNIESDPTRLKQILMNLLGNSAKFTKQGFIETRISVRASLTKPNPDLLIEVKDTGVGIEPSLHNHLFQPFSQGDSSVTRRFGGTGLGLALSRRISEALGGSLSLVESNPGVGSVFRLTLPLTTSHLGFAKPSAPEIQSPHASGTAKPLQGVRILLAEDFSDNEALMRAYLRPTGATLEIARNGQEAFEQALAGSFDVILMDIQMPVMDGLEATRKLREQNYSVPIIALSAHALSEEVQRSLLAGCQAHLTKPVTRSGVVTEIKKVLKI